MSAVDVLAVHDELRRALLIHVDGNASPDHTAYTNDLMRRAEECRASLSELMGAASDGNVMLTYGKNDALYFNADKADRLRAAVARCKGQTLSTTNTTGETP